MTIIKILKNTFITLAFMGSTPINAQQKPNVIIIYSDDQGAIDLNCYGSKDLETPNIDRLAKNGTMFTQFYASPVCSPSRASLLTGLNPQRAGLPNNASETNKAEGMPSDRFTKASHKIRFDGQYHYHFSIGQWLFHGRTGAFWWRQCGHLSGRKSLSF